MRSFAQPRMVKVAISEFYTASSGKGTSARWSLLNELGGCVLGEIDVGSEVGLSTQEFVDFFVTHIAKDII